jgi:hypothetical protein
VGTGRVVVRFARWAGWALLAAATLSGCAAPTLYQWGRYEDAIHDMYINPGSVPIGDDILLLEAEIEQIVASGEFVPPGVHAHLASLYLSEGDQSTAMIHFQTEKRKFPESARFIDGIISRMRE